MKVLHVCAGNLYGGVETYLSTLAECRALCPAMEPEFAVCFPGRLRDELATTGVPLHDLGPVRASRPWTVLRARRRLRRVLTRGCFDAVVCQMPWILGLLGGAIRNRRIRIAGHMHGAVSGGWVEWLAGRQRPDAIIAPSRYTADTWRTMFPRAELYVLNNPLPPSVISTPELSPDERNSIRAEFGAEPDDVVVFQASRMEAWKGADAVLVALARLREEPGWRFWLAGGVQKSDEREYYASLVRLANESGIAERVTFLGQRTDVPTLLRAADIYCQGNRGPEGFSLSFLEASYCRLPVVTTDLGGAGEMVDSTTGILIPASGDAADLSGALRSLIADPVSRAGLGAAARAKAIRLCDPAQQLNRLAGFLAPRSTLPPRRA